MSKVGEHTKSLRSSIISVFVFILQYLNTGVLLLMVTANFKEQGIDPYHLFHGSRTDFGMLWYSETGDTIVQTMILTNIILPILIEMGNSFYRTSLRYLDKRKGPFKLIKWWYNEPDRKSHCISEAQYIKIHAGPTFDIDVRYAKIMTIIWVTMMYGSGLPILFPIALFSIILIYMMDIYMLFYVYRKPPVYDADLHNDQIVIMERSVLIFLAFSTWQLSNNQLLPYPGMPLESQERFKSSFKAHHIWTQYLPFLNKFDDIMFQLGPAIPLWIFFMLGVFILLLK